MKNFIKTSIIPSINLSGRGGGEGKLSDVFCESNGWKRVSERLYDFVHETGLKVELKKQQDVQWFDPSKYHNLTEEEKEIPIVFILHKSGKIDKMFSMKVCTFLDKVGWSEQFCKDAADFVSNYKNSAPQIKAQVKVRNLFANNIDLVEVLYDD